MCGFIRYCRPTSPRTNFEAGLSERARALKAWIFDMFSNTLVLWTFRELQGARRTVGVCLPHGTPSVHAKKPMSKIRKTKKNHQALHRKLKKKSCQIICWSVWIRRLLVSKRSKSRWACSEPESTNK